MSVQFPVVSKPVFIGEFGNDYRKWEVKPGRSNIRYLHEPLLKSKHVHFDLNHGFETFQSKQAEDEKLNMLLKYIMQVSDGSNLKKCIHDSEYVTWRGTMTKIGSSPYLTQDSDAWKIVCCKFQGVIFLCEMTTEIKLEKQAQESPLQKRQTYWGHKFEQYITTDRVETFPITSEPVSTFENYCAVFKLQARSQKGNRIAVFLGAEMDGIDERGDFIELKTQFQKLGLGKFWPEKEMKWWLQSYLVGIERLIVGMRDKDGIVQRLQEVKIQDLRQQRSGWQPAVCINYLLDYMDQVKDRLEAHPDGHLLLTEYSPSNKLLTFQEIEGDEQADLRVIPDYFIQHFYNK